MRWALLITMLAGCTTTTPQHRYATDQPEYLPCPPAAKGPGALPMIVDTATLRAWADKDETARRETVRARNECARSLHRAIGEE